MRCILRNSSKSRTRWDVFIIVMALFNAFSVPYNAAFQQGQEQGIGLRFFDLFVNMLFIVDLAINFRTTYVETNSGVEVFEPNKIARRYVLGGRFVVDMLSSLPLDSL